MAQSNEHIKQMITSDKSDKHLIVLELILNEFGIEIDQSQNQKYGMISSCIALVQLVHASLKLPSFNYKFVITKTKQYNTIQCVNLIIDLDLLFAKQNHIDFMVMKKQYHLSEKMIISISKLLPLITPPEGINIKDWIGAVAFYSIAYDVIENDNLIAIIANQYRFLFPYLDIVDEQIKELKNG